MAAIGDIHGNLPAFEAVLSAVDDAGIQTVVNTGDAVVGYPWPNEVVDLLRARDIASVQGESDRQAARFLKKAQTLRAHWPPADFEKLRWTHDETRSDNLEFLRRLPKRRTLRVEGTAICLCHGSPSGQFNDLREDDREGRFKRQREIAFARLVICGRTHQAFARWVDDTLFVNPGSVGVPLGEACHARYTMINTEDEPWTAEFHRVKYDRARLGERLRECGLPRQ